MKIFDTMSGQKRPFTPLNAERVGLYLCGITVYDHCHIGHARVMVAFDVITRYLRASGYNLNYVRNITDVDDKIFARAAERGLPFNELTEHFIQAMHEDLERLGCAAPDQEPRATGHMADIIALIQRLQTEGAAYQGVGGDVYFRVSAYADYGKLNNRKLDEMLAGARVEVAGDKESPADFVLWKSAKPGEHAWPSPWGEGRPGWHIECSAMSMKCLGESFDIHGGGPDLKFPHHENEIAQSEAATHKPYAGTWMHAGAVRVDNEKMSKSLGNFFTIREVLERYDAELVRWFLLGTHYRAHINYSDQALDAAAESLTRIYRSLRSAPSVGEPCPDLVARFHALMDDDFNVPGVVALIHEGCKRINTGDDAAAARGFLGYAGDVLGVFQQDPHTFSAVVQQGSGLDDSAVQALVDGRAQAKRDRDFAEADRIRAALAEAGIEIEDTREGTRWSRR